MGKSDRRLFVFAWDAATWSIMNRLRGEGRLPNLDRMIREGSSGTMMAEEPMLSPSLWTTISSGKKKEKHGILDFNVSARHVRCKRIWDILEENGRSIGLYGHFVTWPPHAVNGFIIPGFLAATNETYPPELSFLKTVFELGEKGQKRSLLAYATNGVRAFRSGLTLRNLLQIFWFYTRRGVWLRKHFDIIWRQNLLGTAFRFNFFRKLYRVYRPDYAFFHAHVIDDLSHSFWRYLEPEKFPGIPRRDVRKYRDVIFKGYCLLDKLLGLFEREFADEITLVVLSDHGMTRREGGTKPIHYKIDVPRLLGIIGAPGSYRSIDHGFMINYLRPIDLTEEQMAAHERIFSEIRFDNTGQKIFHVRREGTKYIYLFLVEKDHDEKLPTLLDEQIIIGGKKCLFGEIITTKEAQVSGWHDPEGVFVIKGPDIRAGEDLGRIEQTDVAPTLLHLCGLPVGKDMDGRVLEKALDEEFVRLNPPKYIETYEKEGEIRAETEAMELTEEVERKLRDLGYFS